MFRWRQDDPENGLTVVQASSLMKSLADGKGVIHTEDEIKARKLATSLTLRPYVALPKTQFNHQELRHLLTANIAECFGPAHQSNSAAFSQ
ncbi:hypothetical protein O9992_14535 [Vibrio lentus]|nr:hypothetical protein [Vibrio lentus]